MASIINRQQPHNNNYISGENIILNTSITATQGILNIEKPEWKLPLDVLQGVLLTWGLISNLATVVSLVCEHKGLYRQICLLLQHQALADCLTCFCGLLILIQVQNIFLSFSSPVLDVVTLYEIESIYSDMKKNLIRHIR
mgnify:CR=1 FL=1